MFNIFKLKSKDSIDSIEPTPQKLQTKQVESSDDFLTIERAKQLDDNEISTFLKKQFGLKNKDVIEVTGELSGKELTDPNLYHCRLNNVKLKTGSRVEYPLSDLDVRDSIQTNGIYVPYTFDKTLKKYVADGAKVLVKCELELSSTYEREKHKNPLLVNVVPRSVQMLREISEVEVIKDDNGNILVEHSVLAHYAALNKQKIISKNEVIIKELETLRKERDEIKTKILTLSDERSNQEVKIEKLQAKIGIKQESKEQLQNEVEEIKIELDNLKDMHMKKIEKFRSFIKAKADSLLTLEFIDESQYNEILCIKHEDIEKSGHFLDFTDDLNANYTQAISQIQAYLFEKNIIYPKYVLEDYFSLIKTNDLIILAGDSGSGKTNLVKSFADAVGGISKIIPVKPSWTSSEDLLGYYNPLQKTYLSTPFLEALIEASQNPEVPYFICLDEMNLARVEYYFADFLSVLEERDTDPEIFLYLDEESNHVLSEFNNVIQAIEGLKKKYNKHDIGSFYDILKDSQINTELKEILGLSDKVSLISYHSTLRRMLGGILNTPSSIVFPKNVRIIGAINIDETTHYLSPKVLDRAHVIKFDNPLLTDWSAIEGEVAMSSIENPECKIKFSIDSFGERKVYPKFSIDDEFCGKVVELTKEYFKPLGVEVGLRTIRQGLNYNETFLSFNNNEDIAFNNFVLHKILPKFTFDGSSTVGNKNKLDIVDEFKTVIKRIINGDIEGADGRSSIRELNELLQKSKENDSIINYWA